MREFYSFSLLSPLFFSSFLIYFLSSFSFFSIFFEIYIQLRKILDEKKHEKKVKKIKQKKIKKMIKFSRLSLVLFYTYSTTNYIHYLQKVIYRVGLSCGLTRFLPCERNGWILCYEIWINFNFFLTFFIWSTKVAF